MKHAPDPDDPARCRATDLLVTDCSGCRGSDETFVDKLLATEPEPEADYSEAPVLERPVDLNPLDPVNRGLHRSKWWLDTGKPTVLQADSRPFKSSYSGTVCQAKCGEMIKTDQWIVHTTMGGYVHLKCLEEK